MSSPSGKARPCRWLATALRSAPPRAPPSLRYAPCNWWAPPRAWRAVPPAKASGPAQPACPEPSPPSPRAASATPARLAPIGCSAQLLRLEDVLEQPLPFLLLVPGEDSGNDFSVLQPLAHVGGIDRHVVAGWHAAARGQELLGLAAEHEVRAQQGGLGMRRLRTDADRAEQQRHRIERPEIDGRAGQLHVDGQRRIIVEREPIFARADRTCEREVAVDHHRLEHRRDILEQLLAAFLAVVDDHRAQPFVVGVVDGDLAGPFLAVEEFLVTLRQLRWLDQVGGRGCCNSRRRRTSGDWDRAPAQ